MARKILYLMPNAFPGGAERATMTILAAHNRDRYEPVVTFFNNGPLVDDVKAIGIPANVLSHPLRLRHPLSVAGAVNECRRIIRTQQISLVHSCMSYTQLIGGVAAGLNGTPAVLYQHGPLGLWMDGAATLTRCDRILVNSAFTAAEQRRCSWRSRPIALAPYGMDLRVDDTDRAALAATVDREFGLEPGTPIIGIIARFDPWKGIDVALRAVAPLLRENSTLRFLIVGGQYRHFHPEHGAMLRALAEREQVASQVLFAGYQMDVRPFLARMTILIHTSLQPEPFGLTIVEGMAAGVPVIIADAGGAADIVDDGIDGLTHTPGNVEELREAMRRLLTEPALRASLSAAGRRKVEDRYTSARMIAVIESIYDDVLQ